MKRTLIKNTSINYISQFISIGVNLYLVAYLIKGLGEERYGILILLYSIVTATDFFRHGLGLALVKYVAHYNVHRESNKIHELFNVGLLFFFAQALATSFILYVIIFYFLDVIFNIPSQYLFQAKVLGIVFLGYLCAELLSTPFGNLLEGFQRYDILRLIEVLKKIMLATFATLFISADLGLIFIGLAYFLSSMSAGMLTAFLSRRIFKYEIGITHIKRNMFVKVLSFAWPQFMTKIASFLGNRVDVLLIGIFLQPSYIAIYNIIYQLYLFISTCINLVGSAVFPYVSELFARNDKDAIQALYMTGTKYSMFICMPLVFVAIFLSKSFLQVWISPEYGRYGYIAQLYLAPTLLMASRVIAVQITLSLDLVRHLVKYHVLGGVVNFILSLILIQLIGITGVIIGTIVNYLIVWFPSNMILLKKLMVGKGAFIRELLLSPLLVAIAAAPILWFFRVFMPPKNLITLFAYSCFYACLFALLFFYNGFNRMERNTLRHQVRMVLGFG